MSVTANDVARCLPALRAVLHGTRGARTDETVAHDLRINGAHAFRTMTGTRR